MKFKFNTKISRIAKIFILFISLINIKPTLINAEDSSLNEVEINSSTKSDTNSSTLPNNPFELVEMLRRANSMNDATKPSDAIDDALRLFDKTEKKESL